MTRDIAGAANAYTGYCRVCTKGSTRQLLDVFARSAICDTFIELDVAPVRCYYPWS